MFRQILFLGPPGVGKGTYAKRVGPIIQFPHVSAGDLLRREAQSDKSLSKTLSEGSLACQSVTFRLVEDEINRIKRLHYRGIILDGFPRSLDQAMSWERYPGATLPDMVIQFELPDEILTKKLLGRCVCSKCGELYNTFSYIDGEYSMPSMKPMQDNICDKCGGALFKRTDDTAQTIIDRLRLHRKTDNDLWQYYAPRIPHLVRFEAKRGIEQVPEILALIQSKLGMH